MFRPLERMFSELLTPLELGDTSSQRWTNKNRNGFFAIFHQIYQIQIQLRETLVQEKRVAEVAEASSVSADRVTNSSVLYGDQHWKIQ